MFAKSLSLFLQNAFRININRFREKDFRYAFEFIRIVYTKWKVRKKVIDYMTLQYDIRLNFIPIENSWNNIVI